MKIDEYRLSKIILSARKRMNLTQNEVSLRTGITQGTLSKIESYQCSISAKHWFLISKLLDIPSASVWTGFVDRGVKASDSPVKNVYKLPKKYYDQAYSSIKEIVPIIKFLCEKFGEDEFNKYLASCKISELIFFDLNNKINFLFIDDLLNHFYSDGLNEDIFLEIARNSKDCELHGVHSDQYKKKKSSMTLLKQYLDNAPYYQNAYQYKILEKSENSLTFELEPNEHALEYIQNLKNVVIPYKKAFIENFASIDKKEKVKIRISEDTPSGFTQFIATLETI